MGLGVHVTGKPPKRGSLPIRRKAGTVLKDIGRAVDAAVTDPVLRRLMSIEHGEDGLRVRLHPGEEDILFTVTKGRIAALAKTSSAGPGYHAMLIGLLEDVGTRTGVTWSWQDGMDGEGDETGYHEHRDFERLRQAMLEWLAIVADHLLQADSGGAENFRVCLPIGDRPVGPRIALAPMGELTREWCRGAADGNAESLKRAGVSFFTAWHCPDHAEFWASCGRYLMLWDLTWTRPEDEGQRRLYEAALGCFARARDLDPQIALPEAELREAWTLLNGTDPDRPPRPEGLGYRRGPMERALVGAWTASLPGYFRCRVIGGNKPSTYTGSDRARSMRRRFHSPRRRMAPPAVTSSSARAPSKRRKRPFPSRRPTTGWPAMPLSRRSRTTSAPSRACWGPAKIHASFRSCTRTRRTAPAGHRRCWNRYPARHRKTTSPALWRHGAVAPASGAAPRSFGLSLA